MTLGEKMKQARLEAGLSQRQLCGDVITRNMLSQIENGSAKPSMATLRCLAGRLGKPVSYFLEEEAVTSPNQTVMEQGRAAFLGTDYRNAERILAQYRVPDAVFDMEYQLLARLTALELAEEAVREGKYPYGLEQLRKLGKIDDGYCASMLERRRVYLLAALLPGRTELWERLPSADGELLLRAQGALAGGDYAGCGRLLDAAEDRTSPEWNCLRGKACIGQGNYREAVDYFHRAEEELPEVCNPCLELCYRELGDFRQAYDYACRQRQRGEK